MRCRRPSTCSRACCTQSLRWLGGKRLAQGAASSHWDAAHELKWAPAGSGVTQQMGGMGLGGGQGGGYPGLSSGPALSGGKPLPSY